MKHLSLSALALMAFTGVAIAGNPVAPTTAPAVTPTVASNDWGGFYVGGMAASDSGQGSGYSGGTLSGQSDFLGGAVYGAFAGYNIQNGAFVYGGEIAYTASNMDLTLFPGSTQQFYGDAKLRAGYSFGKAMIYGSAGYSFGSFDDNGSDLFAQSGWVAGVGVDVMVTDHLFMGLEYTKRDIIGAGASSPANEVQSEINSIALRVGWNF